MSGLIFIVVLVVLHRFWFVHSRIHGGVGEIFGWKKQQCKYIHKSHVYAITLLYFTRGSKQQTKITKLN